MSLVHDAVDDDDTDTTNTGSNTTYFDSVNNYTFTVSRQNGSTYLRPRYPPPNAVEIRVGVLLPYHQNFSAYTTELTLSGTSAVRLAAAQINTQNQMPGAYITLVEKDSFQDNNLNGQEAVTQAVVAALDLVVHKGVVGVIGDISSSWTSLSALITSTLKVPQCSFSSVATSLSDQTQHDYFFRTIQTPLLYADAGFSFVKSQGWHHVSILYSDDDYGNPLFQYTMLKAKANGIIVDHFAGFYSEADTFADTTAKVHNFYAAGPHIVLFAAQNDALNFAFIAAADAGYIDTDHAWVVLGPVDNSEMVQVVETFNNVLVQRKTDTNQPQLQQQPNMTDMDIMPLYPRAHISSALALKAARVAISPIEYLAWKSKRMQNIVYRQTFDGGIFSFAVTSNLSGYPPYETFRTTWAKLNSSLPRSNAE
ncbi:periplasmic binding protein-like I [Syncephalastrum racemosum]|uniref:Periplasmic binding protein-like I n=1 Tax=Syncephalastrum racemosum TaxID=13706 RepID=A0A1X2H3S4_SYNRA|nr:periplasmic binding protein-like I [Syncephalastrum racemosum]